MAIRLGFENFKAFKGPHEITIKPITLLFGPNSGGKSSVLHSLLYAADCLRKGDLDMAYSDLGGHQVFFGGIAHLVYGRDPALTMSFSIEDLEGSSGYDIDTKGLSTPEDLSRDPLCIFGPMGLWWKVSAKEAQRSINKGEREAARVQREADKEWNLLDEATRKQKWLETHPGWDSEEKRQERVKAAEREREASVQAKIKLFQQESGNERLIEDLKRSLLSPVTLREPWEKKGPRLIGGQTWLLRDFRAGLGLQWKRTFLDEIAILFHGKPFVTLSPYSWELSQWQIKEVCLEDDEIQGLICYCECLYYEPSLRERLRFLEFYKSFLLGRRMHTDSFVPYDVDRRPPWPVGDIHRNQRLSWEAIVDPGLTPEERGWKYQDELRRLDADEEAKGGHWDGEPWDEPDEDYHWHGGIVRFAEAFLLEPPLQIKRTLEALVYLGPLRAYPEYIRGADLTTPGFSGSGLMGWHLLATYPQLRERANNWLARQEVFSDPFSIEMHYVEVPDESYAPILWELPFDERKVFAGAAPRCRRIRDGLELTLQEVGAGVSQMIPVLSYAWGCKGQILLMEQPELHVHPKLQAEMGDVIIQGTSRHNSFLIETHSEHLLLRILRRMRETFQGECEEGLRITPNQVAIYYVDHNREELPIQEIRLAPDGSLLDPWPGGFFEEAFKEVF